MKSNKQRRTEIKARRLERASAVARLDPRGLGSASPLGAVPADLSKLAHNNTDGLLPSFYLDSPFTCRDCGSQEVWTAKQQKWWYEELQKPIDSRAVRCHPCRVARRARIATSQQAGPTLRDHVQALRLAGEQPATDDARAQLEAALHSKWDGLRVTATKALCQWGDAAALEAAKGALQRELARERYAPACWAMGRALERHLKEADFAWTLDLYLNHAHRNNRVCVHPLLQAFGPATVQARLTPLRGQMLDAEGERELSDLLHWASWNLKRSS